MMLLVMFVLGGICGYLLAALIFAGAESLEIKRLKMELEAARRDREFWAEQAKCLREKLFKGAIVGEKVDLKQECLKICDDEVVAKFVDLISECAKLFAKKHNDYGPGNVALFSNVGLYVRMCDKIWRLRNLLFESKKPTHSKKRRKSRKCRAWKVGSNWYREESKMLVAAKFGLVQKSSIGSIFQIQILIQMNILDIWKRSLLNGIFSKSKYFYLYIEQFGNSNEPTSILQLRSKFESKFFVGKFGSSVWKRGYTNG